MRRGVSLVAVTLLIAAGSVSAAGAQGDERPGVSRKEIRVGGVVGRTNPVGRPYDTAFDGVQAYFETVNEAGGVFGRKLKLVAQLDDQSRASQNIAAVRSLVEEKKVFAVLPVVSQVFAGAKYLAESGVPTFGWNIDAGWAKGHNLFGEKGSYLCFTCPNVAPAYIAQQLGITRVGVMAYTAPQSAECTKGLLEGFQRYGLEVVFQNTGLSFGFTNLDTDVQQIRDSRVELIATCMDINGEVNIARALRRGGVEGVRFYAPEGYDPEVLEQFGSELDGFYFGLSFVPWEDTAAPKGTRRFLEAMRTAGLTPTEQAQAGWINAHLLVEGIRKAGRNFTQASVVDAINTITGFTADGILAGINWPTDGHAPGSETCTTYVEAVGGAFVPRFGQPGQPFVCFAENPLPDTLGLPHYKPADPEGAAAA